MEDAPTRRSQRASSARLSTAASSSFADVVRRLHPTMLPRMSRTPETTPGPPRHERLRPREKAPAAPPPASGAPLSAFEGAETPALGAEELDLRPGRLRSALELLAAAGAGLSEARTPEEVAAVTALQGCAALGAGRGVFYRVTEPGDALVLVRVTGDTPDVAAALPRILTSAEMPLTEVVTTRAPAFYETAEDFTERHPRSALDRCWDRRALAVVPLICDGQVRAVLGLSFRRTRAFSADDRTLTVALAQHAELALSRARLCVAEAAARAAAEAANRVKDEFLAVLSHELRTPLTAVLGWTRMLAAGKVPLDRQPHVIETIDRNARAQAHIIEDLLDYSRLTSGQLSIELAVMELSEAALAALEAVRPAAAAKRVTLAVSLDPGVGRILGDAGRVQQVAWNLLDNAVKFTPAGGLVELTLRREGADAVLGVRDTGRGIGPELLPRVFERFWQAEMGTTRAHGGLGLGLSIVRHLVEQHGGEVEARSDGLGRGATFLASFPLEPGAAPSPSPSPGLGLGLGRGEAVRRLREGRGGEDRRRRARPALLR